MQHFRKNHTYDCSGNQKFLSTTNKFDYQSQYNHLYHLRYVTMKPFLMSNIIHHWGGDACQDIVVNIIDCEAIDTSIQQNQKTSIIIGIVYKEMIHRNSIIKDIKESYNLLGSFKPIDNYASENDNVYLEDQSGRIQLFCNDLQLQKLFVSGIPLAIRGRLREDGKFQVENILTAGFQLVDPPMTIEDTSSQQDDEYMIFTSGLEIGEIQMNPLNNQYGVLGSDGFVRDNSIEDYGLSLHLLVDYLSGRIESEDVSNIIRVIIAGNSILPTDLNLSRDKQYLQQVKSNAMVNCKEFDILLSQILTSMPVDLMPGAFDPTTSLLPQPPLKSFLFPNASRFNSLNLVTNPHTCQINENITILGHSGQGTNDIQLQLFKEKGYDLPIDILKKTFTWGHILPTCPDSLGCFPFTEKDPFIIDSSKTPPTILFTSNQISSGYEIIYIHNIQTNETQRTLLLSIPSFRLTREVIKVNLRTLQCEIISFPCNLQNLSQDIHKKYEYFIQNRKKFSIQSTEFEINYDADEEVVDM